MGLAVGGEPGIIQRRYLYWADQSSLGVTYTSRYLTFYQMRSNKIAKTDGSPFICNIYCLTLFSMQTKKPP